MEYFTETLLILGFIFIAGLLIEYKTRPKKTEAKKDYK